MHIQFSETRAESENELTLRVTNKTVEVVIPLVCIF